MFFACANQPPPRMSRIVASTNAHFDAHHLQRFSGTEPLFFSEDPFSFGRVSRNGRIRRLTLHVSPPVDRSRPGAGIVKFKVPAWHNMILLSSLIIIIIIARAVFPVHMMPLTFDPPSSTTRAVFNRVPLTVLGAETQGLLTACRSRTSARSKSPICNHQSIDLRRMPKGVGCHTHTSHVE